MKVVNKKYHQHQSCDYDCNILVVVMMVIITMMMMKTCFFVIFSRTDITRVFYIIKRDGQAINPRVTIPPTVNQVNVEVNAKNSLNMAYTGASQLPYYLHYSIRLNRSIALGGDEGRQFRQSLQNAWQQYASGTVINI